MLTQGAVAMPVVVMVAEVRVIVGVVPHVTATLVESVLLVN